MVPLTFQYFSIIDKNIGISCISLIGFFMVGLSCLLSYTLYTAFYQEPQAKGCVFFFPGISLGVTHSLKFSKSVFFSEKLEKKKQVFFIFSQEQFRSHSLKKFRDPLFLYRKITQACFFFPTIFGMIFVLFFSSEKFTFTHSLD